MSSLKKHIALANEIRKDILAGKYGTEGGLPGLDELSRRSGLARNTVRSALLLLEGEKVIVERDRNYFVNVRSVTMTQYVPPLQERMKASGKTAFVRNLEPVENAVLPDYIADMLNLEHGTPCVFRYRISGELTVDMKEKPTRLLRYYYLIPLTTGQLEKLNSEPATDILFESAPVQMIREDTLSARQLTAEEAKLLDIPENTAVMSVQIVNTTMEGGYLLVQESVFVGVSFTYKYSFENRPKQ